MKIIRVWHLKVSDSSSSWDKEMKANLLEILYHTTVDCYCWKVLWNTSITGEKLYNSDWGLNWQMFPFFTVHIDSGLLCCLNFWKTKPHNLTSWNSTWISKLTNYHFVFLFLFYINMFCFWWVQKWVILNTMKCKTDNTVKIYKIKFYYLICCYLFIYVL